ncbi:DsbA family oxidoreductase [Umezawaea sp. Da 62-37]|uniref:DsbA family oxidoreductase n=1 Tax=Umezawaea sp. Da 62-37 TaxID=3075927 RepID=UPI0028F70123|nr:DsbA family oxidoreductase [Umezawaea sp. Da 62-37]WNV83339.1 DsbA family oxidoreductase [Umezawaea sp. Da 62-37]
MRLEVWSDVVCPWCYIGKRKMESALLAWDGEPVEVRWRPFQLDPGSPNDGAPMTEALAAKFGGAEAVTSAHARVAEVAAGVGLDYHLDKTRQANTLDAHKLITLAHDQGVQGAVQERLFRANFTEGAHLGDPATLVELAEEAGLTGAEEALRDDALAARVRQELTEGIGIGVRSVPTFVVGNRGVSGAQDPSVILELLKGA